MLRRIETNGIKHASAMLTLRASVQNCSKKVELVRKKHFPFFPMPSLKGTGEGFQFCCTSAVRLLFCTHELLEPVSSGSI